MEWADHLREAIGRQEPRHQCDRTAAESALRTSLPADYKEMCRRFGPGCYSWYTHLLTDHGTDSLLLAWHRLV
ncbi:MAG: hypothetical protein ACRDRL_05140 [Sciscionella sp.]